MYEGNKSLKQNLQMISDKKSHFYSVITEISVYKTHKKLQVITNHPLSKFSEQIFLNNRPSIYVYEENLKLNEMEISFLK